MGSVRVGAVVHLHARGHWLRWSLLRATLEASHVRHLLRLVVDVQLGTGRRHLWTLVWNLGLLVRVHVRHLTVRRHHRSGALIVLAALRVRMVHVRLVVHDWLLVAVHRHLWTVRCRSHLAALLLSHVAVIRRNAGLIRVVVHVAVGVPGAVRVHLALATVARVVAVMHVVLWAVPGHLS